MHDYVKNMKKRVRTYDNGFFWISQKQNSMGWTQIII